MEFRNDQSVSSKEILHAKWLRHVVIRFIDLTYVSKPEDNPPGPHVGCLSFKVAASVKLIETTYKNTIPKLIETKT